MAVRETYENRFERNSRTSHLLVLCLVEELNLFSIFLVVSIKIWMKTNSSQMVDF